MSLTTINKLDFIHKESRVVIDSGLTCGEFCMLLRGQMAGRLVDSRNACSKEPVGLRITFSSWTTSITPKVPSVVIKWLTFLLHIRDIAGSNLGSETGYPD
jgi:hypothetical protein